MKTFWKQFWKDTEGQDLVEYALLVAAIALGMIATIRGIANALNTLYESISTGLGSIGQ
ncbi:MAG: Flp family type IVb pilin [Acidobacteria bacterium]|nr:Flp family type IVb pilin [Acidobacteriota bacterium]